MPSLSATIVNWRSSASRFAAAPVRWRGRWRRWWCLRPFFFFRATLGCVVPRRSFLFTLDPAAPAALGTALPRRMSMSALRFAWLREPCRDLDRLSGRGGLELADFDVPLGGFRAPRVTASSYCRSSSSTPLSSYVFMPWVATYPVPPARWGAEASEVVAPSSLQELTLELDEERRDNDDHDDQDCLVRWEIRKP